MTKGMGGIHCKSGGARWPGASGTGGKLGKNSRNSTIGASFSAVDVVEPGRKSGREIPNFLGAPGGHKKKSKGVLGGKGIDSACIQLD